MKLPFLFYFFLLASYCRLFAQVEEPTLYLTVKYGGQLPQSDFKDRFGSSLRTSSTFSYKAKGKTSVLSLHGFIQFGTLVKENIFSNLLTPEGYLIGNDKTPAAIQLRQRAWFLGLGRGLRFKEKSNFLNRINLDFYGGFFQHKIRIQEDPARFVPQIGGST